MVDYTTVPLRRYYAFYTAGFFIFILILAFLERLETATALDRLFLSVSDHFPLRDDWRAGAHG